MALDRGRIVNPDALKTRQLIVKYTIFCHFLTSFFALIPAKRIAAAPKRNTRVDWPPRIRPPCGPLTSRPTSLISVKQADTVFP
jgi:hypothetical protein